METWYIMNTDHLIIIMFFSKTITSPKKSLNVQYIFIENVKS